MDFETEQAPAPQASPIPWPSRLAGIGMVLFALFLILSILSFNVNEVSWSFINSATHEQAAKLPCTNWMGVVGMYCAGLVQLLLGGGAFYAAVLLGIVGIAIIRRPYCMYLSQWLMVPAMVLTACAALDITKWILTEWAQVNGILSPGGAVGYLLGACVFNALLGNVWSGVLVVTLHGVALVVLTRVTPKSIITQAWRDSKAICVGCYRLVKTWRSKAAAKKQAKRAQEEECDWKSEFSPQPEQPNLLPMDEEELFKARQQSAMQQAQRPAPAPVQRPQPTAYVPTPQPRQVVSRPVEAPAMQRAEIPAREIARPMTQPAQTVPAPVTPRPVQQAAPAQPIQRTTRTEEPSPARRIVQTESSNSIRRPHPAKAPGDNLLDLMEPVEETIAHRYAPNIDPDEDEEQHGHVPLNKDAEEALNKKLGYRQADTPLQVPARKVGAAPTLKPTPAPRPRMAAAQPNYEDTREQRDDYRMPPYDLLNYVPVAEEDTEAAQAEMAEVQQCIIDTLENFRIKVTAGDITRGPSITRYEFYPPKGLALKRITNLSDNLKMATCSKSINILAPVPGKDTIGIELENAVKSSVYLRELLQSPDFHSPKLRIPVALGKDVYGTPVIGDLAAMPHTLVAGTTGSGKSVCINSMILSMIYKFHPDDLRLVLVDPKVVEMQPYKKLPHLACPVVTSSARVIGALRWAVNEMEKRYSYFSKVGVRNFEDFNNREPELDPEPEEELVPNYTPLPEGFDAADAIVRDIENSQGLEDIEEDDEMQGELDFGEGERIPAKIPYIVIIIDELADLMMQVKEDLENYIARLTQKARAAGIHLVAATQTPRANVITGIIKANIPSRLAFKVASPLDSRVILDANGAENLLGKGDFLFLPPGGITRMTRAQGAFVTDGEIANIVKFCSDHAKQKFVTGITEAMDSADGSAPSPDNGGRLGGTGISDEDAELYTRCVNMVVTERKASTSLLQRRFGIGYGKAARMMDLMEQRGVIGPASSNTARPREVLIEAQ